MLKKFRLSNEFIFFSLLSSLLAILYKNAFTIGFFQDDFFYIKLSQIESLKDFLYFFYPFKAYFFRPIPSEVFYNFLSIFNYNLVIGHLIVLTTFFVGLIFLYKSLFFITKSRPISYLTIFMYSVSLTHVFQLYWFATFQEVALFTFLSVSFYFFTQRKYLVSLTAFLFALLSKETAILFPILLISYIFYLNRQEFKKYIILFPFIFLSLFSFIAYKTGVNSVEQIEIYKIHFDPKLILNNTIWYLLWSLGFPNFLPNYVKSILLQPLPDFWNLMRADSIRTYMLLLSTYLFLLITSLSFYLIKNKDKLIKISYISLLLLSFFLLFILPTLPIIHKWMVRLTVPLLFLILLQSYLIHLFWTSKSRVLSFCSLLLVIIYFLFNLIGINVHESSGLFDLQNKTVASAEKIFSQKKEIIIRNGTIYFTDEGGEVFGGSKGLKNTFHNQDFISFYFKGYSVKAIYEFENSDLPKNAVVIKSGDLLK